MKKVLPILIIALVGFLAYSNSLSNGFVWDDSALIHSAASVNSLSGIANAFERCILGVSGKSNGYYRPLQLISYAADRLVWGYKPLGYHLTSVITQILNSILLFYFLIFISGNRRVSLGVACIFCVHPAFIPNAGYISGRADLLGFFFTVSSVFLMIRYIVSGKGTGILAASCACYIMALLSREYCVIAPLFVLLYMVSFKDKIRTRLGAFIGLIALASIAFMYVALRCTILNFHQDTGIIGKLPVWIRILLSPYLFTGYLRVLAVPVDLGFDKKLIASSLADPRFVASWITVFVIAAIFYYLYKKGRREKLFYLSWFVIGIIPVLHVFVPLVAIANDHWTYIPSLGYFAFFLSISDDWLRKILPDKRASHAFALICAILTIFYATVTHTQNRYWKDDESLFTRMYAVNKYTGRTQFNLARVYEQKGQYGKAMEFYDMAIKSSEGRFAYMYNARGMLRIKTGDMAGAKKDFEAAAEIRR